MNFAFTIMIGFILGAIFFYILTKWILVPFYCTLNQKLDYTIYYEEVNSPFSQNSYSVKGFALNNIISLPLTALFTSVIMTILGQIGSNYIIIIFLCLISLTSFMLYPSIGQYIRPNIFITKNKEFTSRLNKKNNKKHEYSDNLDFEEDNPGFEPSLTLDNTNEIYTNKYFTGYMYLLGLVQVFGFMIPGFIGITKGSIVGLICFIIGFVLITLTTWFPDKFDKYWPWDFKRYSGIRYLIISEVFIIIIILRFYLRII